MARDARRILTALTAVALLAGGSATADDRYDRYASYEIHVTNLTKGQTFTPILTAIHRSGVEIFRLGEQASGPLEVLAESGDTGDLSDYLLGKGPRAVGSVQTEPELLEPGETRIIRVRAHRYFRKLSLAAMLIPTNDTFVALNGVPLPGWRSVEYLAPAYDAGSEENDQYCPNIPGPRCDGEGSSEPADSDEGFVGIGNGFHDLRTGDASDEDLLPPLTYDWRNPVARIVVERVR